MSTPRDLFERAVFKGAARLGPTTVQWDVSGTCDKPLWAFQEGALSDLEAKIAGDPFSYRVEMKVPCRKCRSCLAFRAYRWRTAALAEIASAERTWFGTLTFRPSEHVRALYSLPTIEGTRSPEAQAAACHNVLGRDVTKWLKRVRKLSGASLRYLCVVEAHTERLEGFPHYHLLIHERSRGEREWKLWDDRNGEFRSGCGCQERLYRLSWSLGVSEFTLVPEDDAQRRAAYLCKYLSKSMLARVRASLRYGSTSV